MEFTIYPFGNAQQQSSGNGWKFTCQHGVDECQANMYQACGISHNNETGQSGWWPYVYCMEGNRKPSAAAKRCATDNGLDWAVIQKCAGIDPSQGSSDDGNLLMHSIAQATLNLKPSHQWTPWVVLNGRPLSQSKLSKSLIDLVCDAYQGDKPSGCKSSKIQVDYRYDGAVDGAFADFE